MTHFKFNFKISDLQLKVLVCFVVLIISNATYAQRQVDLNQTVQLEIDIDQDNNQATLKWDNFADTDNYLVFKRLFGENSWGSAVAVLDGQDTSYVISDYNSAVLYEFKVSRSANTGFAEGYLVSGTDYYAYPFGRGLVFVSEQSITDSLSTQIEDYIHHIRSEGWMVHHLVVDLNETASEVKAKIQEAYENAPDIYSSILLFGHVPVPYSGAIGPDGHGNHIGAWPADGFYGDINGNWTDSFVSNTTASQSRNHNVPGDGKFDQNGFPSDVELAVGRIDFANMPVFDDSEVTLLRKYIDKNLKFRRGEIRAIERGVIENNFNLSEGFGQSGIKNFTAFFGRDSVHFTDFDAVKSESYLWSYGAGGGNFQGASGISNSTNMASDSIQTVFTMLFGSYFGDWDSNNNFLRSALASGTCLSNAWAGRPVWMFHPMAMGKTLGDCTRITQNNFNQYVTGFGSRSVHIALMGDPTLKMYYPSHADTLFVSEQLGSANIVWEHDSNTEIDRYHLYRSVNGNLPILIATPEKSMFKYVDSCLVAGVNYTYFLAAAKIQKSASGEFWNESMMITDTFTIQTDNSVTAGFSFIINPDNSVSFSEETSNADYWLWDFGDGSFSNDQNPEHQYQTSGDETYQITLIAGNDCFADTTITNLMLSPTSVSDEPINSVSISPNPVNDILKIQCISCTSETRLTVMDMSGRLCIDTDGPGIQHLNTNPLVPGLYILKVTDQNMVYTLPFIKSN